MSDAPDLQKVSPPGLTLLPHRVLLLSVALWHPTANVAELVLVRGKAFTSLSGSPSLNEAFFLNQPADKPLVTHANIAWFGIPASASVLTAEEAILAVEQGQVEVLCADSGLPLTLRHLYSLLAVTDPSRTATRRTYGHGTPVPVTPPFPSPVSGIGALYVSRHLRAHSVIAHRLPRYDLATLLLAQPLPLSPHALELTRRLVARPRAFAAAAIVPGIAGLAARVRAVVALANDPESATANCAASGAVPTTASLTAVAAPVPAATLAAQGAVWVQSVTTLATLTLRSKASTVDHNAHSLEHDTEEACSVADLATSECSKLLNCAQVELVSALKQCVVAMDRYRAVLGTSAAHGHCDSHSHPGTRDCCQSNNAQNYCPFARALALITDTASTTTKNFACTSDDALVCKQLAEPESEAETQTSVAETAVTKGEASRSCRNSITSSGANMTTDTHSDAHTKSFHDAWVCWSANVIATSASLSTGLGLGTTVSREFKRTLPPLPTRLTLCFPLTTPRAVALTVAETARRAVAAAAVVGNALVKTLAAAEALAVSVSTAGLSKDVSDVAVSNGNHTVGSKATAGGGKATASTTTTAVIVSIVQWDEQGKVMINDVSLLE